MLEIIKNGFQNTEHKKKIKKDIIITQFKKEKSYDKDGNEITKRIPYKINITKKVNETKKLIKEDSAAEKLAELEKVFRKGE